MLSLGKMDYTYSDYDSSSLYSNESVNKICNNDDTIAYFPLITIYIIFFSYCDKISAELHSANFIPYLYNGSHFWTDTMAFLSQGKLFPYGKYT